MNVTGYTLRRNGDLDWSVIGSDGNVVPGHEHYDYEEDADAARVKLGRDSLVCMDGPEGCAGPVEMRTTPDREDFAHFPRCEAHFERRLLESEKVLELLSPTPPAWFDPSYAGEHWDEED